MDDLTGLIIYLILAILGVLAGIYRNKNKHKSVLPPPAESSSAEMEATESYTREYDPFAGIFEEKAEEEDLVSENKTGDEALDDEPVINKEELIVEQDLKKEDSYDKEYIEGEAVFDDTKKVLISDEKSEIPGVEFLDDELIKDTSITDIIEGEKSVMDVNEKFSEIKEGFDARKAIIYSEIMKRWEY